MNYLTYLKVQGHKPKAIQIDRGKEFVNKKLERWYKEHGIELRLTTPYSLHPIIIILYLNILIIVDSPRHRS